MNEAESLMEILEWVNGKDCAHVEKSFERWRVRVYGRPEFHAGATLAEAPAAARAAAAGERSVNEGEFVRQSQQTIAQMRGEM